MEWRTNKSRAETETTLGQRDYSLFRTLIRTTGNGVVVTDADGLVLFYNDAAHRLFHRAPEEVLGGPIDLLLPPVCRPQIRELIGLAAHACPTSPFSIQRELQGLRKDGSQFPMQLSIGEGELEGEPVFLIVLQDLTQLYRERHALDEEKAYLAQIVESSSDAIVSYMLDGTVRSWNRAAEEMFGYRADEIVGATAPALMPHFVPPEMIPAEIAILARVLAGESVPPHETVRLHKNGTPVAIVISASPIRDANGAVIGIARTARNITERKKHEHARALLDLAIDNSDDAFTCIALDGTVITWNRGAETILGWMGAEIIGRNAEGVIRSIVPADLQPAELDYSRRAIAGEKIGPYESIRIRKNGSRVRVLSTVYPVRNERGEVLAIARTLHDLTDRLAFEEQRALLGAIINSSTDAIISYALDGTITSWNRAAELMYGYRAEEMIGTSLYGRLGEFMPPERVTEERRIVARVIAGERVPPYEATRSRKDGGDVHVLVSVSPIKDASGAIIGTSRVVRDISERKVFERQRALLSSIVESSNDAVFTKMLNGIVTSWNAAADAMFGYSSEEIVGRSMLVLVPEDLLEEERNALEKISRGDSIRHFETVRRKKDGSTFAVSLTLSPVRDADGAVTGASATIRDITDRKNYESRLESMRADMIHVARVHELSQVSAGIAHELNQPLAAMLNYSNVARRLVQSSGDLSKLPEVAAKIGDQAERAAQIIRRMRDFVEKRDPHRAVIDIQTIADDAIALALIGSKTANIETRVVVPETPLPVLADRVQVQQVLVNLLRNAAEAMATTERRELTLAIRDREDRTVEVSVVDTGTGLSDEVAARLFSPFVTTKPDGMGIGLAISRQIIEAHGGTLIARPNPGGGAIFEFTLPAADQSSAASPSP
ncbi:PAS domain S-box protein [Rhizomicrobium electricum]|uniref:histidine kinase n=1 Tax=Rhizomicrobium electricum TaxID=480070 RepID=A0ABN1EEB9_9PROT|nr:PAS domain S-box protein [Rhizomicrobium electricum]NIJ48728.1 PAS domain S-box-containing protein [Rhizomicrobium electricum]